MQLSQNLLAIGQMYLLKYNDEEDGDDDKRQHRTATLHVALMS